MSIKLCFIAPAYSIHTQRWVKAFAERDAYDVTLLSPYGPPSPDADLGGARTVWYDPPVRTDRALSRYRRVLANYTRMRMLLLREHFDVVHIHQLPQPHTVPFFFRIPRLVVSTWGADIVNPERLGDPVWSLSRRFILRQAAVVTATSQFLADVTAPFMQPRAEVIVVPFGIEVESFACLDVGRRDVEMSPIRLITTKHLRPKYGIHYLLEALRIVADESQDVELLIAGEGEQRVELESLAWRLNLQERVHFLGRVPHQRIGDLLCSAHIYVMPSVSDSESFGVAALEAQAARLPVVASSVGGVPEVVLDGETGLLVPPHDVQALAHAVLMLIRDSQLRFEMGQAGHKFVREYYSWSVCVEKMHQVYQSVLTGRPWK